MKSIAENVSKTIRKSDILCRWGGEEFVLLIPNTTKEDIIIASEKVRKLISDLSFEFANDITVSLGVTISKNDDSTDSVITRADQALYESKNTGKNKTTFK